MENIKLFISSILIFISFFIWYYFSTIKYEEKLSILENKKYYINIEKLKTKMNFSHDDNVIIRINWEDLKESNISF